MANWNNPQLTSTYTNFVTEVKDRDTDVAKQFNNPSNNNLLGSNHATGTIRWDGANNKWLEYNGTSWVDLTSRFSIDTTTVMNCAPNDASGANNLSRNNGTLQNNLNADKLDGQEGSYYRNATNINTGTISDARLPNSISSNITGNAASATNSTTFTCTANNATNETVYPVFVDGTTGSQGAETDSGFTYNPSSGNLTVTTLTGNVTGNLTGNVTGSVTGNASTATTATTATTLATGRTIGMTGDVVWTSASFDGSGNVTGSSSIQASTVGNTELDNNAKIQISGLGVGTAASATTGEIRATNNITAYYSDDRLKIKTGNITNALDKTISLNGFKYVENNLANSFGYNSGDSFVGVSAQEVQKVLPEAVKLAPFDSDENNKSKSGENYLTVQYEKLVPLLVESIKELKDLIDIQSNRIQELEAKLGV